MSRWLDDLDRDGIVVVPDALPSIEVERLIAHLEPIVADGAGDRSLHHDPVVRELAVSGVAARLAAQVLGEARVVRVLYFDKNPEANWKVPYHQDVTLAVRERVETAGFSAWSTKAGMNHVRAPGDVLQEMVAVRLHLDLCGRENGPLRAIPGSHRHGKLAKADVERWVAEKAEETYPSPPGGAILMRPLTLHASSPSISPNHRRVIHIEYARAGLPSPLEWALGWPVEIEP